MPLVPVDPVLTDRELAAIVDLVYDRSGITLHHGKRALVTARLQKRLRAGGFTSFSAYLAHVDADRTGGELTHLLDAIATNHTSFFREPQHFAFLREQVMARPEGTGRLSIWSAGCSTGEEAYSLAMELADTLADPAFRASRILASDLSTRALRTARAGVYRLDRLAGLPVTTLRRHFERGLGEQEGLARVRAELRRKVDFRQINLLEVPPLGERFDVIFCRNVLIYFDRPVQQRVLSALVAYLAPGGYLFISHAESLNGLSHPLTWIAPAVYRNPH